MGKSSDIAEELRERYPVSGPSLETWWHKNVRPALMDVGNYPPGEHGYRVTNFGE